jgi:nucleoside-diphosphate-sugar epimerase
MRPGDGRVVSNFIVQALRGDPITIYGDGTQTRSFTFVDDLIEGIFRLFFSDRVDPTNIGNPGEFTIRELADLVVAKSASRSQISYRPLPEDDPRTRRPDIRIAREVLNWEPEVSLDAGLDMTIPYLRNLVENADARARIL